MRSADATGRSLSHPESIRNIVEEAVLADEVGLDRAAAGVGWSKMGMIRGKAHLDASLALVRA